MSVHTFLENSYFTVFQQTIHVSDAYSSQVQIFSTGDILKLRLEKSTRQLLWQQK